MSRRKRLQAEVDNLSETFKKSAGPVKDFRLEEEALYFTYVGPLSAESFILSVSDYPDACMLFPASSGGDSVVYAGKSLSEIVAAVVKEYGDKAARAAARKLMADSLGSEPDSDLPDAHDWRGSSSTHVDADDEAYALECAYQEHKDLTLEADNYKSMFGDSTVSIKPVPLLETVDVELQVPFRDVLQDTTCAAWGIDVSLPIHIRFTFSADYYLDTLTVPKFEVYQRRQFRSARPLQQRPPEQAPSADKDASSASPPSAAEHPEEKKFGLRYQLEAVLKAFVTEQWPENSGRKIKAVEYRKPSVVSRAGGRFLDIFRAPPRAAQPAAVDRNHDRHVAQLLDMGFSAEMASNALVMSNGNLDQATELLLTSPDACLTAAADAPREAPSKSGPKKHDSAQLLNAEPAYRDRTRKPVPSSQFGWLCMIGSFVRARLPNLNDFCVICDQPHVFAHGNMLKPAVCSRDLCVWAFQNLKVGAEAAEDIATAAEVVDLLCCFATIAAKSPRSELIFDPYPTVMDPKNSKQKMLDPAKKDFSLVNSILSKFPSVEKMSKAADFGDMKQQMDRAHPAAYPLLQWIISSNRSHIVKLPPNKSLASMETPHQYLLLSAPPEKEARFAELKRQHGSCFAFHGSPQENWHSIMRMGLKNASGTSLQINGAAYGSGIYLSPHAATSFGYSRLHEGGGHVVKHRPQSASSGNRFLGAESCHCIAICEVINKDIRKSGTVWVQPEPEAVVTRFFFVYTGLNPGKAAQNSTENAAFIAEIERAIAVQQS